MSEDTSAPSTTELAGQASLPDTGQEIRAAMADILGSVDLLLSSGLNEHQRDLVTTVREAAQFLLAKTHGENNLLNGYRVLLFDTHPPARESLGLTLGEWGMQVTAVTHASEFSSCLEDNGTRPNVVVISVNQEHLDSGEFDEWLHLIDWTADYRVLVLTSGIDAKVQKRMLRGGVHACLSKPLQTRAFRRILYRLLHPNQPGGIPKPPKTPGFRRRQRPSPRILVVEPNPASRQHICGFLGQKKACITLAVDGAEAIEQVPQQAFDLVLMDIERPTANEIEIFRHIRNIEPHGETIPIVVLTADLSSQEKAELAQVGVNEYLQKPVDMSTLWSSIMKWTAREPTVSPSSFATPAAANGEHPA